MPIEIRPMRNEDARAFLEVHRAAVHGTAAKDYPRAVIEDRACLPITDEHIEGVRANRDREIRLLAEIDGEIVGLGAIVLATSELRACYVAPGAARKGVGSALVRQLERIAREHGVERLELDASLTSERFYVSLGYQVRERGEHVLRSGRRMACVRMAKCLSPATSG